MKTFGEERIWWRRKFWRNEKICGMKTFGEENIWGGKHLWEEGKHLWEERIWGPGGGKNVIGLKLWGRKDLIE